MGCLATLWFIAYPVLFVLLPALGGATGGAGGAFAGALGSVALAGLFWPWLIGLFVLGLLALVTRPRQRLEVRLPAQQVHSARPVEPAPSTKACPMCAETVMVAARICRYCGHQFGEPSHEPVEALAQAVAPPSLPEGGGATRLAEPVALAATQAARPGDSSPLPDARVPAGRPGRPLRVPSSEESGAPGAPGAGERNPRRRHRRRWWSASPAAWGCC
jgi:Uncharacterised protein family UPF0547